MKNQPRAVVARLKRCTRGVTVAELSERLGIERSVVTATLNSLEAVGFVTAERIVPKVPRRGRPEFRYIPTEAFLAQ